MKKTILTLFLVILLSGCIVIEKETEFTEKEQQIANPASVYCIEQGGLLRIETNEKGEYGICTLEDGTECEEWAYYRGECP